MLPAALQFLIAMVAYGVNERMARRVEYLQEEVRVLKEVLSAATGKTRINFSPAQRRLALRRNLLDPEDGFLRNASYLIHDRDPVFTESWSGVLATGGVKCVPIPARSPNCNPHAARFEKTIRTECLDHFIIFGERHLRHLIREFLDHYLTERYHQGIGSQIIRPNASPRKRDPTHSAIGCRSRLGGVLNSYSREAA
jgi:hypothetical protein